MTNWCGGGCLAIFTRVSDGVSIPLLAHHTFGRRTDLVDTAVENPLISKIHAVIEYHSRSWFVRDLGGCNGTFLNDERIADNIRIKLNLGDKLQFAACNDAVFKVRNLAAPASVLFSVDDVEASKPLQGYNLLPGDSSPQCAVYYSNKHLQWVLEDFSGNDECLQVLEPRKEFDVDGQRWLIHIHEDISKTLEARSNMAELSQFQFCFQRSQNCEHVSLLIQNCSQGCEYRLGERAHHELLYFLAEQRLVDETRGLNQQEVGWIDTEQLCKAMGLDLSHINILLFRAKKQVSDCLANTEVVAKLIERRRGEIRFAHSSVTLSDKTSCLDAHSS